MEKPTEKPRTSRASKPANSTISEASEAISISPETKTINESIETEGAILFASMAKMIAPHVKPDYDYAKKEIEKMVKDAVSSIKPERIEVFTAPTISVELKNQHESFKTILNVLSQRLSVLLVGPAGSGKTTCAHNTAIALGLNFYAMSVGQQTTKSDIFGFVDAHSNYRRTHFRDAYENGGIFLFDEIDAGNPGVLTSINSALANGLCSFPDGMIERHKDFVCVAAGNTFGRGADRQYVGRQQLDAATLDRFVVVDFDYDENLESEISGNKKWAKEVQRMRGNAMKNNLRVIISPRATIHGAKLLAAGLLESEVKNMVIFKGVGEKERNIIEKGKA